MLLISANTEQVNMRTLPWGLWCVASACRARGHQVATLDLMEALDPAGAVAEAVGRHDPQLIGISVRNIDDQRRDQPTFFLEKLRGVVQACRCTPAPIVLGGAGYSIFPQAALEYLEADLGIQGEGESALPALAEAIEHGAALDGVPGLFARGRGALASRRFIADLDEAPFPDDECLAGLPPLDAARPLWVPLQLRRGCALGCAYCSTSTIEGEKVRRRSVAAVLDWLERNPAVAARPLYLVDNNFNVPRQPAMDLCRAILERGLQLDWRCILNPMHIDEELTSLMARAGCREVALGFEAGSAATLRGLNKPFTLEEVRRGAACLRAAGIRTMGFLLLGGPGETRETAVESLTFADSLGLDSLKVTLGIRVYPGTPLAELALAEGQIVAGDDLLRPRFYTAAGLEPWLSREVEAWCAARPGWLR